MATEALPVGVLQYPHWRVNIRPDQYDEALIPSLSECVKLIEQTQVRLRGWPYPCLIPHPQERGQGNNWIASWSDFRGHIEYWRFYQSGQFIHRFSVKEVTHPDWHQQLLEVAKHHPADRPIDWASVPGFINITNFLYTVTEIFEFATRLCEKGIYKNVLYLSIQLEKIKGFMLTTEWNRAWYGNYTASEARISKAWTFERTDLIGGSAEHSLKATVWFLERFGWMSPAVEILRHDQQNFLKRHQ